MQERAKTAIINLQLKQKYQYHQDFRAIGIGFFSEEFALVGCHLQAPRPLVS
jgi:hypothetical protein